MRDEHARPLRNSADAITLAAVAGLLAIATLLLLLPIGPLHRAFEKSLVETDFRAFYCAARVTRERQNPYLGAPLEHCQQFETMRSAANSQFAKAADPAPQPSYDFALLAPLSFLPFYQAAVVWSAFLTACLILSAWLMSRLSGIPFFVVLVVLSIIEGYRSISYGQIPPAVIAAICLSAFLLIRGRPALAALSASFSMIEPNMGLPVCIALFVWEPRARLTLVAMGVLFAIGGIVAVGPAANATYFAQVLPVHQLSELGDPIQYSLTWLLYEVGAPAKAAVTAGSVSYLVLLLLSIAIAPRLTRAFNSRAPVVLFPPAAVMLGGPYVHVFQIAAALPFALYAAGRAPAHRGLAWAAVALIALDWPPTKFLRLNILEALVIVALVVFLTPRRTTAARSVLAIAACCIYVVFAVGVNALPSTPLRPAAEASAIDTTRYDPELASAQDLVFRRDVRWQLSSPQTLAAKLPTWIGLVLVVTIGVLLALGPEPVKAPSARPRVLIRPRS
jgi:hypothetical protein